jgi:two-component system, cell cycle sensor histidine kinase DivJ
VSFLTPVWNYVDALVHPAAQQDAMTAARHRAFIAPRLLGSFVALASFPVHIAVRGVPSALEIGVFSWLVAPILIVYYLSRTGRYESAHILSSLSLTVLASAVALATGGIGSFAVVWLVVVPLEAALSASRRVVATAAGFALIAAAALFVLGVTGMLPEIEPPAAEHSALVAIGVISAMLYATGLALGVESFSRTNLWLLRSEEERYRLLANNMTDVVARFGRAGSVLFVSPTAELLIGVQVKELLGDCLFERVHVADRPAYLATLADTANLNEERSLEFRIRRGGGPQYAGQFVWVEMMCRPFDCAEGNEPQTSRDVVAVLRDISERKLQERAVEIARVESERASTAKFHFLATMSHELRTPLNAIIGFSEIMTNDSLDVDAARRREYARLINESGRHLLSVVNGILDASKMETGNFEVTPEPFAPAPAIVSVTDLLALKAQESGVELKMRLAPNLPELAADRRAFNQILINLISNAIKFTPRGGRVTVSAFADGGTLALAVEDTGVGIGEGDLPHLGEPFFQAHASYDRRHDGSGLGLSIVKGLVGLHGGDVEIRSRLGEGTRVTVRLPVDCESARPANEPIKLVIERNRALAGAVKNQVKKSA